ncbi:IQ motif EF-hand binding site [Arabidopsis thaliana x Arabidopsis arenosa]|uniref:IQ motif EF-hand binding site n=1 Tax=Arabidopsis thaliana x Arabidopsis arenosa TaxID=1240361 RepID=A0A8T1ZNC2_9BRAS|nr:IQ motif EF-hand binding site [Arabidopsis thaliana x Arabidopsis arenosa]
MGKTGGSSWFTAVKNVFRSPEKKIPRRINRRQDNALVEEEKDEQHQQPKRRKRRWLFKKASSDSSAIDVGIHIRNSGNINSTDVDAIAAEETEKTASPAAKETVFFGRISVYLKRHLAAILIQTAFRGCLARTAFRALQGVVKLQALVRGHIVRRRAGITLLRVQALVQIQARALDHRKKLTTNLGDETALSHAFSKQMWKTTAREAHSESELEDKRPSRLNRYGYQETGRRMSTDQAVVEPVKIVEIDTYKTYAHHQQLNDQTPRGHSCVTRQVHSIPNYMSTTASTMARFRRPHSVPKQRSNRTGLDNNEPRLTLVRKRLSFHNDNPQSHDYIAGDGYFWYDIDKRTNAHEDFQY